MPDFSGHCFTESYKKLYREYIGEATNRRDFMKKTAAAYNAATGRMPSPIKLLFKPKEKIAERIPKIREDIDYGIFSDGILPTPSGNFYLKPDYLYNFATAHILSVLGINRENASSIMNIIRGIQSKPYNDGSRSNLEERLAQISKKTEITPERIGAIIAANEDNNRSLSLASLDNIIYWVKKKNVSDEITFRIFKGYVNQLGGAAALAELIKELMSPGSDYLKMKKQNSEAILPPVKNLLKVISIQNYLYAKIAPQLPEGTMSFEEPSSLDIEPDWHYDDESDPFIKTKERFYESRRIRKSAF